MIDLNVIQLYLPDVLIIITLCFLNREGKKPASSLQAIGMLQASVISNIEPFLFCFFRISFASLVIIVIIHRVL